MKNDLEINIGIILSILTDEINDHNFSVVYTRIEELEILIKAYELLNYDCISLKD